VRSENLEHPKLILGERKKMKAYFINPNEDIDVEELRAILVLAMGNY